MMRYPVIIKMLRNMEYIYNVILRKCWIQDYYSMISVVLRMSSKHKSRCLFGTVRFWVITFFLSFKKILFYIYQIFHNELTLSLMSLFPSFFYSH